MAERTRVRVADPRLLAGRFVRQPIRECGSASRQNFFDRLSDGARQGVTSDAVIASGALAPRHRRADEPTHLAAELPGRWQIQCGRPQIRPRCRSSSRSDLLHTLVCGEGASSLAIWSPIAAAFPTVSLAAMRSRFGSIAAAAHSGFAVYECPREERAPRGCRPEECACTRPRLSSSPQTWANTQQSGLCRTSSGQG